MEKKTDTGADKQQAGPHAGEQFEDAEVDVNQQAEAVHPFEMETDPVPHLTTATGHEEEQEALDPTGFYSLVNPHIPPPPGLFSNSWDRHEDLHLGGEIPTGTDLLLMARSLVDDVVEAALDEIPPDLVFWSSEGSSEDEIMQPSAPPFEGGDDAPGVVMGEFQNVPLDDELEFSPLDYSDSTPVYTSGDESRSSTRDSTAGSRSLISSSSENGLTDATSSDTGVSSDLSSGSRQRQYDLRSAAAQHEATGAVPDQEHEDPDSQPIGLVYAPVAEVFHDRRGESMIPARPTMGSQMYGASPRSGYDIVVDEFDHLQASRFGRGYPGLGLENYHGRYCSREFLLNYFQKLKFIYSEDGCNCPAARVYRSARGIRVGHLGRGVRQPLAELPGRGHGSIPRVLLPRPGELRGLDNPGFVDEENNYLDPSYLLPHSDNQLRLINIVDILLHFHPDDI